MRSTKYKLQKLLPPRIPTQKVQMLLDSLHTYPDATLRYFASDMILPIKGDSTYLVLPQTRSRAAAWFSLGNNPTSPSKPLTNAPLHVSCNTIKNALASAGEVKAGGVFLVIQTACQIRCTRPSTTSNRYSRLQR